MSIEENLIRKYRTENSNGVTLVDLSTNALAGYYLHHYKGRPVNALNIDMSDGVIASTKGRAAGLIITAALAKIEKN